MEPEEVTLPATVPTVKTLLDFTKHPTEVIAAAQTAAKQLKAIVDQKPKPVIINGERYLEFEDWQTIGAFYGITPDIDWTRPIKDEKSGELLGYEARATALFRGEEISHAEADCRYAESNWRNRDAFALKSMAQTRAAAKALRNVLAWQVVLAGFRGTPAEEMVDTSHANSQEQTLRAEIRAWLLDLNDNDEEAAKKHLMALTEFKAKSGEMVRGVASVTILTGKRLEITHGKLKRLRESASTQFPLPDDKETA